MTPREYALLLEQASDKLQRQERRENARFARLMALIASCLAPQKNKKPYKPEDFMPEMQSKPAEEKKPMDWQDMKRLAMGMTTGLGGEVKTGGGEE